MTFAQISKCNLGSKSPRASSRPYWASYEWTEASLHVFSVIALIITSVKRFHWGDKGREINLYSTLVNMTYLVADLGPVAQSPVKLIVG